MEQELRALQLHASRLLDMPNVVGVGIGPKMRAGMRDGNTAVVVLVTQKISVSLLDADSIIPNDLDGVVTDIMEVGNIQLLDRTSVLRPATPGSSIGHFKVSAGTFGAVVYDRKSQMPLILSNNHILANISNGRDGRCALGDPIYQPGSYDGGTSKDIIGNLYRFVPIEYETKGKSGKKDAVNRVDAAVAQPVSPNDIAAEIIDVGQITGAKKAEMNMKVKKSGRTSGVTSGKVRVLHTTLKVDMDENRYAVFDDQVVTDMVSKPGDSGSLVLTEQGEAVGLLFAGSDRSAIFTPIENVLSALDVTMVGNSSQIPPVSTMPKSDQPLVATTSSSAMFMALALIFLLFWLNNC